MAPLPKADGTRVRRNLGQKNWRTVTRGAVKAPPLPGATGLPDDVRRAARAYWKAIWHELGELFIDADRFPLARLCVLDARVRLGHRVGAQLQAELRQLEQAYGISAIGRQRLMVHVGDAEKADGPAGPVVDMARHRERRARITGSS